MSVLASMKVWHKFALIGAVALAMAIPPTVLLIEAKSSEAEAAAREQAGLAPAAAVLKLVQLTQKHRGLSGGVLGGNAGLAAAREATQAEVSAALARALDASRLYENDPSMRERVKGLEDEWKALAAAVAERRLSPPESFARHTAMVTRQLGWLGDVADASTLSLDPEAASYYLVLLVTDRQPALAELLGQARARGTLGLTQGTISPELRAELGSALRQARSRFAETEHAMKKAGAADASTQQRLAAPFEQARSSLDEMLRTLEGQVLGATPSIAAADYFARATTAIDAQYALVTAAAAQLSGQLEDRTRNARVLLWATLAGVLAALAVGVWLMVAVARSVVTSVKAAGRAAEALASGDLSHAVQARGADELAQMTGALGTALQRLGGLVSGLRGQAESMAMASQQIASGNLDLSSRTEQQASSLEQTASAMAQMTASVGQTAQNARRAMTLADGAHETARVGQQRFDEVAGTMQRISESSRRVAEIVGTIDSIAFQTNLLALNAAVEAARAGAHGRGFAVVASDVRALASRSAGAAQQIRELISESGERVELGDRQTRDAGLAMTQVVSRLGEMTALVTEIAAAADEQSRGIGEVNTAVAHIDQMTQQNAALVEQTAAAANSLSSQAAGIVTSMAVFRTAGNEPAPVPA